MVEINPCPLPWFRFRGILLMQATPFRDARGWMAEHGRNQGRWDSVALVKNRRAKVRRGLHFQIAPRQQAKLIQCVKGAIRDVFLDLRPKSPTRGRWGRMTLKQDDGRALYLPKGFAHGYETVRADSWVLYVFQGVFSRRHRRHLDWSLLRSGGRKP